MGQFMRFCTHRICEQQERRPICTTLLHETTERDEVKRPGLEVIKLEFILRLKIKRNDWLLATKLFHFHRILKNGAGRGV